MVRNAKIFVVAILLACVQSFAGYFIEQSYDETPAKDSLSSLSFGGELELVYYLSSIHPGFLLSGEYRFHKHHSVDLFAVALFSGDYFELGADWRFFFRIELDASYIIGRALVEHKDDDLFGRESHFAAALNIGFYLF